MEFLYFLEDLRTPVLDTFFSLITHLGEETIFIVLGILFFWCLDKKQGYYLLSIGLLGTIINQFLKLLFRIPRPWVKDPQFTIVESARAEATGYSFPSGHTQASVGIFGGIARANQQRRLRILCIALCILVPLSRMYLGVHTPADVVVSIIVALVLIFGFYPILHRAFAAGEAGRKTMRIFMVFTVALAIAFLLFVHLYPFPADIDPHNFDSGMKNAYKMLGCLLGLWLAYEVDMSYTHFDTKAVWWIQIIKLILGLLPVLAIKAGLKEPLYALISNTYVADGLRYFLLTAFAGAVWPLTFKWWRKIGKK